jgi:hypothetical protein
MRNICPGFVQPHRLLSRSELSMLSAPILLAVTALLAAPPAVFSEERSYAVIVHISNPNREFRMADLRSLFSGATRRWPDRQRVVLAESDPAGSASKYLLGGLLGTSPAEYKRRLANIEFIGEEGAILRTLNSDTAACKFVFNVPSAIGLVEAASLQTPECRAVRPARVEGRLPGEEGYRLK